MFAKIALPALALLVVFLGYVATRKGEFRYERSGLIQASPEKIFPYLSNLKNGGQWSPYEKMDPQMKKTFSGKDGEVGSSMDFEGNSDVGSGKLEILGITPNQIVQIRLTMTKPIAADNLIEYNLAPEGAGTRFTWSMSGNGGFMGKLMTIFIDCEKMVAGQFEQGIQNLKTLLESQSR